MTGTNAPVYDAFMPTLWRVRPIVCLLLAVSTAVGAVAPARVCACTAPAGAASTLVGVQVALPTPAVKSCCQPAAGKRSCCSASSTCDPAKASCCGNKAPATRTEKAPPAPTPSDPSGCHCLRCDCDAPAVPPVPAPAPATADLTEHAAVSPVPAVLIAEPPTASSRVVRLVPSVPHADLVISLSRLTC